MVKNCKDSLTSFISTDKDLNEVMPLRQPIKFRSQEEMLAAKRQKKKDENKRYKEKLKLERSQGDGRRWQ